MYSEHKHVLTTESTALGVYFPWLSAGSSGFRLSRQSIVLAALSEDAFRHG